MFVYAIYVYVRNERINKKMSAYSDYKHGLITRDQYYSACRQEEWLDAAYEDDEDSEEDEEE